MHAVTSHGQEFSGHFLERLRVEFQSAFFAHAVCKVGFRMSTNIDFPHYPTTVFFNFLTSRTDTNISIQHFDLRREICGSPDQAHSQKAIDCHHPSYSNGGRGVPADEGENRTQDSKCRHGSKLAHEARQIDGDRIQHGYHHAHRGQKIGKKDTGSEGADDKRKPGVIAEKASGHSGLYHRLPLFNTGGSLF